MSMHVYAVKPADENYKRKAEAWRACKAAGISIPQDLASFFGDEEPDPTGMTQHLGHDHRIDHQSCVKFTDDSRQGFEVDITKLPEGARFVRFVCSW
jgi:hypothetical protein